MAMKDPFMIGGKMKRALANTADGAAITAVRASPNTFHHLPPPTRPHALLGRTR
jgi:hypothetical protein